MAFTLSSWSKSTRPVHPPAEGKLPEEMAFACNSNHPNSVEEFDGGLMKKSRPWPTWIWPFVVGNLGWAFNGEKRSWRPGMAAKFGSQGDEMRSSRIWTKKIGGQNGREEEELGERKGIFWCGWKTMRWPTKQKMEYWIRYYYLAMVILVFGKAAG